MTKPSKPLDTTETVAELERLAHRIEQATEPSALVALADELDAFGRTIALEIRNRLDDVDLKRVMLYVPTLQAQALLRAAERFDDLGSPKRAAYVLFEALRTAFDPQVITTVAEALSFILEANDQPVPAARLRALLLARDEPRAAGASLGEIRSRFALAIEELRDQGVAWNALADSDEQFD